MLSTWGWKSRGRDMNAVGTSTSELERDTSEADIDRAKLSKNDMIWRTLNKTSYLIEVISMIPAGHHALRRNKP